MFGHDSGVGELVEHSGSGMWKILHLFFSEKIDGISPHLRITWWLCLTVVGNFLSHSIVSSACIR